MDNEQLTTTEQTQAEFLSALRERRNRAIASFDHWLLTRDDMGRAYGAGERNFNRADLREADLSGAYLRGADLSEADLSEADLSGADLNEADLRGADLRGADLRDSYSDFIRKCMKRPHELSGLRLALVEGRINGNVYEGECACFVGTLANVAQCDISDLGIEQNSSSPIERLFFAIKTGDTPETNPISKIVVEWIDELIAFGGLAAVSTSAVQS